MNKELIDWSESNFPDLPWRNKRSLYGTLVSEIMLQQTTVTTVLKHFERFMGKFPSVEVLATAKQEEVLRAWEGLGYYRRARNLHAAAIDIYENFNGEIPLDREQLKQIKGIGDYTASALRAIGADTSDLAVDANLERVLARFYGVDMPKGPKLQKEVRALFDSGKICSEMDELGPRKLNEALMDLGRTICQARSAACEICPLRGDCSGKGNPLSYASAPIKERENLELHLLRVIVEKKGKYLSFQKSSDQWLSGQYELPTFTLFSDESGFSQYKTLGWDLYENLPMITTGITKYKIRNFVLIAGEQELQELGISSGDYEYKDLKDHHFSTASLKAIQFFN